MSNMFFALVSWLEVCFAYYNFLNVDLIFINYAILAV